MIVCMVVQDGKEIQRTFEHVPSSVGALEAEEVSRLLMECRLSKWTQQGSDDDDDNDGMTGGSGASSS